MNHRPIAADLWRGGTSKGLFFLADQLPPDPALRDALLLLAIGSPDPYGKQVDGLGGGTSSTSKVVLVKRAARVDCDIEYLFGAVAIDAPLIDWSGNCGNLTTAVAPFAIVHGMVAAADGRHTVRLWQANLGKRIVAHLPVRDGQPVEQGDFAMDGVAFTGTGAVALSVAAALPGSVVQRLLREPASGTGARNAERALPGAIRVGTMTVGAEVRRTAAGWTVDRSLMSRSARRLRTRDCPSVMSRSARRLRTRDCPSAGVTAGWHSRPVGIASRHPMTLRISRHVLSCPAHAAGLRPVYRRRHDLHRR